MTEIFDNADTTVGRTDATDAAGVGPVVARTRAQLRVARAGLGDGDIAWS